MASNSFISKKGNPIDGVPWRQSKKSCSCQMVKLALSLL